MSKWTDWRVRQKAESAKSKIDAPSPVVTEMMGNLLKVDLKAADKVLGIGRNRRFVAFEYEDEDGRINRIEGRASQYNISFNRPLVDATSWGGNGYREYISKADFDLTIECLGMCDVQRVPVG